MLRMFFIPMMHGAIRLNARGNPLDKKKARGTIWKNGNTHLDETMLEANEYNLASASAIVHHLFVVYCLR